MIARNLKSADASIITYNGKATSTSYRLCHSKGGTSVENAEILYRILVDRHLGKYGFIVSWQKPDTKRMVHSPYQTRVEYITLFLCHYIKQLYKCTVSYL
jgi:hypothetical protein